MISRLDNGKQFSKFIMQSIPLLGAPWNEREKSKEITLSPGLHVFPFSFMLPVAQYNEKPILLSTTLVKGVGLSCGKISYSIVAQVDNPHVSMWSLKKDFIADGCDISIAGQNYSALVRNCHT